MSSPRSRRGVALLTVAALVLASATAGLAAEVSLSTARLKAAREGKVLLVDFWASYCLPCRMMDETTFADPHVLSYLREHYVSIKIDVENFDGLAIQQQYGVQALPTMLIFSSTGEEVDRIDGPLTAAEMLVRLRQNDRPAHRTPTPGPAVAHDWTEPFARMSNAYAEAAIQPATSKPAAGKQAAGIQAAGIQAAGIQVEAVSPAADIAVTEAQPGERILATATTLEEAMAMSPTHFEPLPHAANSAARPPARDGYADLATTLHAMSEPATAIPAPTAPPAAAPAPASPCAEVAARLDGEPSKVYSLQAFTFRDEANAMRAAAHLRGATDMPISIEVDPAAATPAYRVLVGRFRNEADAAALGRALLPSHISTETRELAMW